MLFQAFSSPTTATVNSRLLSFSRISLLRSDNPRSFFAFAEAYNHSVLVSREKLAEEAVLLFKSFNKGLPSFVPAIYFSSPLSVPEVKECLKNCKEQDGELAAN